MAAYSYNRGNSGCILGQDLLKQEIRNFRIKQTERLLIESSGRKPGGGSYTKVNVLVCKFPGTTPGRWGVKMDSQGNVGGRKFQSNTQVFASNTQVGGKKARKMVKKCAKMRKNAQKLQEIAKNARFLYHFFAPPCVNDWFFINRRERRARREKSIINHEFRWFQDKD